MTSMVELGAQALRLVNNLKEAEARGAESVLSLMGLQRRQSVARPLLWFAAGATVAAGAALLLAPMKGEELVDRIARGLKRATSAVEDATKTGAAAVRSPATHAESPGPDGFEAKTDHV
jgi:hypothetical protein